MSREWFEEAVSTDLRKRTSKKVSSALEGRAREAQTEASESGRVFGSLNWLLNWQGSTALGLVGAAAAFVMFRTNPGRNANDSAEEIAFEALEVLDSIGSEPQGDSIDFLAEIELLEVFDELELIDSTSDTASDSHFNDCTKRGVPV